MINLKQIIKEEIHKAIIREKKSKKSDARSRNCPSTPGNQFHRGGKPAAKAGQFSSKEDHGSRSLYFSCKKHGRSGKDGSALTDPSLTGRGKLKDSKGKYRAYDNQKVREDIIPDEESLTVSKDSLVRIVMLAMKDALERIEELVEEPESIQDGQTERDNKIKKLCTQHGYKKLAQFLKYQDLMQRAASGDLFKN